MDNNETQTPPKKRRFRFKRVGRLDTVGDIVTEMGRVYRQARCNEITTADASRLANILTLMRGALESSDLEARMAALEKDEPR